MAPKRNVKRAAGAAVAEEPPLKKLHTSVTAALKKYGVTQATYRQIEEILTHPTAVATIPEASRAMLIAGLPHSLCVASDDRQEHQEIIVTMLGEVVTKVLEGLQAALDAENEKVSGVETSKAGLEEKVTSTEAALEDAKKAVTDCEAELSSSSEAAVSAKAELAKCQEEQQLGDASLVTAKSEKEVLESAYKGCFDKLKVGGWEAIEEAQTLFQELLPFMKTIAMDESLKTATESTLMKKPESRGSFDSTCIDELDKCFQVKIAELEGILATGQPASEARATAVTNASAALQAAEAAQETASEKLLAAKATQKDTAAELKTAKAAVVDYQPEYQKATEIRDQEQQKLQLFVEVNMGTFEQLKSRISARKQREIKAAEAAAAAAAAAEVAEAEAKAAAEAAAAEAEAKAAAEAAEAAEAKAPAEEEKTEDAPMEQVEAAAEIVEQPSKVEAAAEIVEQPSKVEAVDVPMANAADVGGA
eukprot:TRINITY_DN7122_c0_g1_i2.p1 TRINITY_DN7122_c0_g1~~TRINITY_DN7122_c0_g1_i2.p1  ORF type:complete len:501 (+),score=231.17 TRINITY_DN7122_c0_g1_i2:70-1503(+)